MKGGPRQRPDTGKWEVRYREGSRHRSRSFTLKRDADTFWLKVRRARETGRVEEVTAGSETLSEFFEVYWRRYALPHLTENTRRGYEAVWLKHIRGQLGDYRLREVSTEVVEDFQARLAASGVGAPTIRKAVAVLQGVFNRAVAWGRLSLNPAREAKKTKVRRSRLVRPLAPETVEQLRSAVLMQGRHGDATLLSVLAYAGLRPEEALALRWNDVGRRSIRVERAVALGTFKEPKTGRARTVRLLDPLRDDLAEWRQACGGPAGEQLVFPNSDGEVWDDYRWRNWRKRVYRPASEAAGITGTRPYDLRHSFVSLLIHEGLSAVEVARQAGNSPAVALGTYAHVFDEFDPSDRLSAEEAILRARDVREEYAEGPGAVGDDTGRPASDLEADARTRTGDPFITHR